LLEGASSTSVFNLKKVTKSIQNIIEVHRIPWPKSSRKTTQYIIAIYING
jgi:hypothetical protein